MRTLLKSLLGLCLTLLALVILAMVAIGLWVDPNDYKQDVIRLVKEQTGRELVLSEPINLSVFPWLGIETGGVSLGNAPKFGDTPFAQIQRLELKLKLLPLLSRRIEADTLLLQGARIHLQRNAQGQTNWEDLTHSSKPAETAKPHTTVSPDMDFNIQRIAIQDAHLSWQDQVNGQQYQVQNLNLVLTDLAAGATAPLQASLQLHSADPALQLQLKLTTQLGIGPRYQRYTLHDILLSLDAQGQSLPAKGLQFTLGAAADLNIAQQTVHINQLKLDGPQIGLRGQIRVSDWAQQPRVQGQLQLTKTNLQALLAKLGVSLSTQNAQAFTQLKSDLTLEYMGQMLTLKPFQLNLDQSTLAGQARVELGGRRPAIQTNLRLDQINLDDYLPPPTPAVAQTTGTAAEQAGNPLQVLHDFDLQATLAIERLQVKNAQLRVINLQLHNQQGLLRIKPLQAKLYEGALAGAIQVDARQQPAQIAINNQLTGIQIGPLLQALAGQDRLLGRGDLKLDLQLSGLTEASIRRSLQGTAALQLSDGAYQGVNLAELIQGAAALLGKRSLAPAGDSTKRTDFAMLKASLQIKKGVVRNRDLQLQSPLLRITGQGTVDLAADQVDYVLTTKLVKSLTGQGGKSADQLRGLPIPVKITGPFANLSYKPDLSGLVKTQLKQQIQEEKQKIVDKAKDKLKQKAAELIGEPEGLKDALQGLRGLFGR